MSEPTPGIKINVTENFVFPNNANNSLDMAPLTTARAIGNGSIVLIRVVAFIPKSGTMIIPPTLKLVSNEGNELKYCVEYNQENSSTEDGYEAMYFEDECPDAGNITQVEVCVYNEDPRTSRGTITTVQTS